MEVKIGYLTLNFSHIHTSERYDEFRASMWHAAKDNGFEFGVVNFISNAC